MMQDEYRGGLVVLVERYDPNAVKFSFYKDDFRCVKNEGFSSNCLIYLADRQHFVDISAMDVLKAMGFEGPKKEELKNDLQTSQEQPF
jgi:hypothetical protein